jgi:hypothetical protein
MSESEWQASAWSKIANEAPITVACLHKFVAAVRLELTEEEVAYLPHHFSGARFINDLPSLLPGLSSLEAELILLNATKMNLLDEDWLIRDVRGVMNPMIFLAEQWTLLQSAPQSTREQITALLESQVGHLLDGLMFNHRLGMVAEQSPLEALEKELLNIGLGNPGFREALRWLLSDWSARRENAQEARNGSERWWELSDLLSEMSVEKMTNEWAKEEAYSQAVMKFSAVLKPTQGKDDPWYDPVGQVLALIGDGITPKLDLAYDTERHRDASLNLLKGVLLNQREMTIGIGDSLPDAVYRLLDDQGRVSHPKEVRALVIDYLNSEGSIGACNFLGLKPSETGAIIFLRELRGLKDAAGVKFVDVNIAGPDQCDLILGVSKGNIRTHICRVSHPVSDPASPGLDFSDVRRAILEAALLVAVAHGAGPFGLCACPRGKREELDNLAKQMIPVARFLETGDCFDPTGTGREIASELELFYTEQADDDGDATTDVELPEEIETPNLVKK